ncbi:MAG: triphosphoribosyl-dephospho-CoA synthase [Promethearchaeota archaeon]
MSLKDITLNFSVKSIDDLLRCINLASLLEIAGWPKPGNISRTKDFDYTRFEHLLAGIAAIQPNFRKFCEKIFASSIPKIQDFSYVGLGNFFKEAAKDMVTWQKGGNVLLGHILILAPLAAATTLCLKFAKYDFNDFKYYLNETINDSTVNDTKNLYEAIRISKPGGLGKIEKYDIYDDNSIKEIQKDKITLKEIFELSKGYDLISLEYSTGFNITLNEGLPYFFDIFNQYNDINIATVNTFLKILSSHPDTLIIRKSGKEAAVNVSNLASNILKIGGISSKEGHSLTIKLDDELQEKGGRLNPGTTADLIAGILFCAIVFGLRF